MALLAFTAAGALAQTPQPSPATQPVDTQQSSGRVRNATLFSLGVLSGLAAHEAGHVSFDLLFDADPRLKRVDFHGIPFFAIAHRPDLTAKRELAVSSAGFWVQHAGSEWILTKNPRLRERRAPVAKGILAFNIATSAAYAAAAFARTGPAERDTRGIASASRIDERWVGAMVLAPATLDAWRYFHPEAKWAAWTSRGLKAGMLLLMLR